jgi:hypothetical protein
MRLSELLAFHQSHAAGGDHADILGDGYLLRNNLVYRNIKRFALGIGAEYLEAWPRYLLMPFHELNHIVATKQIPYVPSARLLQEVDDRRPDVFDWQHVPPPESYHLHEAAHVIAEHLFVGVLANGREGEILKAILCESFANTVDALACACAWSESAAKAAAAEDNSVTTTAELEVGINNQQMHLFFIGQNSYMKPERKSMKAIAALVGSVGFRAVFSLTLFEYVHANFLKEPMSRERIAEVAGLTGAHLNEKNLKACEAIGHMAQKLDPQFRLSTTEVYLKAAGFEGDLQDLLDFPFMKLYAGRADFGGVVESMADVVTRED